MVGRSADLVVLSDDERCFLESQVRRHEAPRSLSDRCRMILLCANGLGSKVGLYLSPPNRAIVLCVDEKSQIQALDREQPVLPMMPGVAERQTHTYIRHGTTSMFAALDIATGAMIGKCYKRYRAKEFLDFLKQIDARMPEGPMCIW
jgi:DDE superfamily endonuclease